MKNKKAIEFNFAWLFAIIAGAVILFLAIYFSSSLIKTSNYKVDTVTAKQLGIIFEPMETGLASAKKISTISLKEETRIYNDCYDSGAFGQQRISLSSKSLGKWSKKSADIPITNKYIFSDNIEQSKDFYSFSKPLNLPWKVSELIFLTSSSYCFTDAPEYVQDEIKSLSLENIKLENCSKENKKVCFSGGLNCDIKVNELGNEEDSHGTVVKDNNISTYSGSLMYAAIFSSPEIYECNIKRLAKRLLQQALIYEDESRFLSGTCGTANAIGLISVARIQDSGSLIALKEIAKDVNKQNEAAECKLW
ncbi:MAG: hypothetical protein NT076_04575 [Candidatus Pacearchaeota archaeon]|nr:hypothetical protein [Candidatus Pacearchaeota archaeon]